MLFNLFLKWNVCIKRTLSELQRVVLVVLKVSWYPWDPEFEISLGHPHEIPPYNLVRVGQGGLHTPEEKVRYSKRSKHPCLLKKEEEL